MVLDLYGQVFGQHHGVKDQRRLKTEISVSANL